MPHCGHVPFTAGLPFFIVTACGFLISTFALHFTQYAWGMGGLVAASFVPHVRVSDCFAIKAARPPSTISYMKAYKGGLAHGVAVPAPAPASLLVACPDCGEETLHTVLWGTMGTGRTRVTIQGTVRCDECRRVHHAIVREAAPVDVPAIVSRGAASTRSSVSLGGEEFVAIGDELLVNGERTVVTGIEVANGHRVRKAGAREVATLWLTWFEELDVPIGVNLKHKTSSHILRIAPDDPIGVGDEVVLGRLRVVITALKTPRGAVHSGSRPAREVQRVYARPWRPEVKPAAKAARDAARWKLLQERQRAARGERTARRRS